MSYILQSYELSDGLLVTLKVEAPRALTASEISLVGEIVERIEEATVEVSS